MEEIKSNIINNTMILREILSCFELQDLYPQIIHYMYNTDITKNFMFCTKNMFEILKGISYNKNPIEHSSVFNDSYLRNVCSDIDLRAKTLNIKTSKQYCEFLDYCIVLFLSTKKILAYYENNPLFTFNNMLNMLIYDKNFVIQNCSLGFFSRETGNRYPNYPTYTVKIYEV